MNLRVVGFQLILLDLQPIINTLFSLPIVGSLLQNEYNLVLITVLVDGTMIRFPALFTAINIIVLLRPIEVLFNKKLFKPHLQAIHNFHQHHMYTQKIRKLTFLKLVYSFLPMTLPLNGFLSLEKKKKQSNPHTKPRKLLKTNEIFKI